MTHDPDRPRESRPRPPAKRVGDVLVQLRWHLLVLGLGLVSIAMYLVLLPPSGMQDFLRTIDLNRQPAVRGLRAVGLLCLLLSALGAKLHVDRKLARGEYPRLDDRRR